MLRAILAALILGPVQPARLSAEFVSADHEVTVDFHVPGPQRRHGLLLQAPDIPGCPLARYRIEGGGASRVSLGLAAGEMTVVRLRGALPAGPARLVVTPLGCRSAPTVARRVILAKASPDHSWRAGLATGPGSGPDPGGCKRALAMFGAGRLALAQAILSFGKVF